MPSGETVEVEAGDQTRAPARMSASGGGAADGAEEGEDPIKTYLEGQVKDICGANPHSHACAQAKASLQAYCNGEQEQAAGFPVHEAQRLIEANARLLEVVERAGQGSVFGGQGAGGGGS